MCNLLLVFLTILMGFSIETFAGDLHVTKKSIESDRFTLSVQISPIANLTYRLNCITGVGWCSDADYLVHWNQEIGFEPSDSDEFKLWTQLQEKYMHSFNLKEEEMPSLIRGMNRQIAEQDQIIIAGLSANSLGEYQTMISKVMSDEDSKKTIQILERLLPRFKKWWNAKGVIDLVTFRNNLLQQIDDKKLLQLFEQVALLYSANLPIRVELPIHLISRLKTNESTHAECIESHSIIEVMSGENPDTNVDVIAHELFHYFYKTISIQKHFEFVSRFSNASESFAVSAYNLFNESMATALGQGVVQRQVIGEKAFNGIKSKELSFYGDEFIDRNAKALLPLAESYLNQGKSIYDPEFVPEYIKVFETAQGNKKNYVGILLKNMWLAYDDKMGYAGKLITRKFTVNSLSSSGMDDPQGIENARTYSQYNGVILLSTSNLSQLKNFDFAIGLQAIQEINEAIKKGHKNFIYGASRPKSEGKACVFIFIATDANEMNRLIKIFTDGYVDAFTGFKF